MKPLQNNNLKIMAPGIRLPYNFWFGGTVFDSLTPYSKKVVDYTPSIVNWGKTESPDLAVVVPDENKEAVP